MKSSKLPIQLGVFTSFGIPMKCVIILSVCFYFFIGAIVAFNAITVKMA